MEKENVKKIKLERELKEATVLASKDAGYLFRVESKDGSTHETEGDRK